MGGSRIGDGGFVAVVALLAGGLAGGACSQGQAPDPGHGPGGAEGAIAATMAAAEATGADVAQAAVRPDATDQATQAQAAMPMSAMTQADYVADCSDAMVRADPRAAKWASDECAMRWRSAAAGQQAVDVLLAARAASAGGAIQSDALRPRLGDVQWRSASTPKDGPTGTLGDLTVVLPKGSADRISFNWSEPGAFPPYDVAEALRVRGATLAQIGCSGYGAGENTTGFRVAMPGADTFALVVYRRDAPTADAWSLYSASARLDGHMPTRDELLRENGGEPCMS